MGKITNSLLGYPENFVKILDAIDELEDKIDIILKKVEDIADRIKQLETIQK